MQTLPRLFAASFVLLAIATSARPLFAQDKSMRDSLGTRLTATPEAIVLDWDPKHVWNADIAQGANLMAEYNTRSQGVVVQSLSPGRLSGAATRSMRFLLPEKLIVPPVGSVCLFVRLTNNKVLPVRKPDGNHNDTARFRDASWEAVITAQTQRSQSDRFQQELQEAVNNGQAVIDGKRQALLKTGWTEANACKNVSAPSFASATKPVDVLPPEQHAAAARRACITRVLQAENNTSQALSRASKDNQVEVLLRHMARSVQPPAISAYFLSILELHKVDVAARRKQLANFQKDWDTYSKHPDPSSRLVLGDEADEIDLQEITTKRALQGDMLPVWTAYLLKKPLSSLDKSLDLEPVAGFAGGQLEAYSRCVDDSQKQLRSKLDQWNKSLADAPRLNEMARSELVASCEKDAAALNTLIDTAKLAQLRLEQAKQSTSPPVNQQLHAASQQNLNATSCTVQR